MKLDIYRLSYGDKSTPGKLSVDGIFECLSMELTYNGGANEHNVNCIPEGTYGVTVDFSPRHQKNMIEITGVPNRLGIRFDVANYPHELKGCIAVGETRDTDFIGGSLAAYQKFFPKVDEAIKRGELVTIEIHGPLTEEAT